MRVKDSVTLSTSGIDTIVHKIQEPSSLVWGTELPFQITYFRTCVYSLVIVDDSASVFDYIYPDEATYSIRIENTINSDYPLDTITLQKPT